MIPIENAKKFTDITPAETIKEEDLILLHDGTGVKSADFKKIRESLVLNIFGNPNLLDNAYFMGDGQAGNFPIDQNADGIPDRWQKIQTDYFSVAIQYTDKGIEIANDNTTGGNVISFNQVFNYIRNDLPITVSVFVDEFSGTWFFSGSGLPNVGINSIGVTSITIEPGEYKYSNFYIFKTSSGADDYIVLKVCKVEYGRIQTVGHQENGVWILDERPPKYGAELLECQRYYQLYSSAAERPAKAVDCRPAMRIDPTQGTTIIGGVTYYYNNASL